MKYIEFKNFARKTFPSKIFQGKHFLVRSFKKNISLQDLPGKTLPCKILQEKFSLQDLVNSVCFARILQDPCKVCIYSQPGYFPVGRCETLHASSFSMKNVFLVKLYKMLYFVTIYFHSHILLE